MAESVLLYGKSGSGKTRSLLNFGEEEILYVNVANKRPPFRKQFKYTMNIKTTINIPEAIAVIKSQLKKMPCKAAVIDDAGYLMTNQFMQFHSQPKKGSSSFDLFNDIADQFWGLLGYIKNDLPEDVIVYIVMHEDTNDYGDTKLRTIGKLLNEKVCIEGLCTIVLRCLSNSSEHYFVTQTDGKDITKSPEGMFSDLKIENDLKAVDEVIREYYGMSGGKRNGEAKS